MNIRFFLKIKVGLMQKFYLFWLVGVLILTYLFDILIFNQIHSISLCSWFSRSFFVLFVCFYLWTYDDLFRSDQRPFKLYGLIDVWERPSYFISERNTMYQFLSSMQKFQSNMVCWFYITLSLFYFIGYLTHD